MIMASGRKRLRPLPDTSFQDEDDVQSNKFVRLRNRTRAPAKIIARSSVGNSRNSSVSSSVSGSMSNLNASSVAGNSSQTGGNFGSYSPRKGAKGEKVFKKAKPKPFYSFGRDSDDRKQYRKSNDKTSSNPKNLYKKKHPGAAKGNEKIRGPVPSTPYGIQTPEFMKVKEDESILEEKRERKRRRNKIMSLRTSKGQPVMRGRIELMLEEIKASTQPK